MSQAENQIFEPLMNLEHSSAVTSIAISNDGNYIVAGCENKTAQIWDMRNGKRLKNLEGHIKEVKSVAITNDCNLVATGSMDRTLKIWDIRSGAELNTFSGHRGTRNSIAFSGDNKYLYTLTDNGAKKISINDGRAVKNIGATFNSPLAISKDEKHIIAPYIKYIRKYSIQSETLLKEITGHQGNVNAITTSNDGKYIISGSDDHSVKIWHMTTGAELKSLQYSSTVKSYSAVTSIAISSDDKYIAAGYEDSKVLIWDLQSGNVLKTITGHSDSVTSVAISNDSKYIVTGSNDKTVKIWEFVIEADRAELEKPTAQHTDAFKTLAASLEEALLRIAKLEALAKASEAADRENRDRPRKAE